MRRRDFLAGLGASVAALGGCAAVGSRSDDYDVGMTAEAFDPFEVTVAVGGTVRWRNTSSRAHTVTAYGGQIPEDADYFATGGFDTEQAARDAFWSGGDNGALTSGDVYEHAFEVPGTYNYFCIPHEKAGMVGRVVVEE